MNQLAKNSLKNPAKRMLQRFAAVTLIALSGYLPSAAWSCSAAGDDKHVGNVLSVDQGNGSFSIMDAETRQPIHFQATTKLITQLMRGDRIIVQFKQDGNKLTAVAIN